MVTFDLAELNARLRELEEQIAQPGFWNDAETAGRSSQEHARIQKTLQRFESLQDNYRFLEEGLGSFPDEELLPVFAEVRGELNRLQEDALFNGEYDGGDAVVTIQSGGGGTDSQDWAEMLLRMYQRWAERRGFRSELVEASPGEEAGLKSATMIVHGDNAYGVLKTERGPHRLVRLSPFDQAHRRHTSFAGVIVSPLLDDDNAVDVNDDDLRIDTYRASGAGGQHVNKTDSAVRITHLPTGIVVSVQNERSQSANKQTAMKILRSRLAERAEEEREAELAKERGDVQNIGFGGKPVRHYVLHPYQQVTDERTGLKVGNAQGVLDGDLDEFVHEYLLAKAAGKVA